jgi:Zn-dependent M28 family amino/carboxypeptidase
MKYKVANARSRGARAVVSVTPYYDAQQLLMYGYPTDDRSYLATLATDRDSLSVSLPSLKQWVLQIDGTLRPNSRMTGVQARVEAGSYTAKGFASNVIAVIPGNDPVLKDQLVVIGSHLDHMGKRPNGDLYPGADDNASGTAVMMELARSVVASGLRPARTLMFASYNAEELGLIGSCYYVQQQPLYPVANTRAMISVDMVGLGPGAGLDLYGATDADKGWIARVMANASAAMGMNYKVNSLDPMMASDHACFAKTKGVPAVMALSTAMSDHPAYHTPRDTAAAIGRPAIEASLDLLWAFLVPVAMGTEGDYDKAGSALECVSVEAAQGRQHPLLRGR